MQKNQYAYATLRAHPHLFAEVIKLIENSLKYSPENHYKVDFLPLVDKTNHDHIHLTFENGKLIAVVGCYPGQLEYSGISTPIVAMGAICVHENYRGQGLFRKVFQEVLNHYHSLCSMFFLWSDLFDLYAKFDFIPAIAQYESLGAWDNMEKMLPQLGFFEMKNEHLHLWPQIQKIWDQTTQFWWRWSRDQVKWGQIVAMKSCQKYIRLNQQGHVQDYFFAHKGEDLSGIIHEFGTIDTHDNLAQELATGRTWTVSPTVSNEFYREGNSSLVKIGSKKLFCDFISQFTQNKIKIIKLDSHQVSFDLEGQMHHATPDEFLPGVLGPFPFIQTQKILRPIFIGGVDSV